MISIDTGLAFFSVSLLLAATPGPDNLFVLLQSARYGPRAGMLVVLGLCTGLLIHTAAAALGLAAVFSTSAFAFNTLTVAGACYLLYLAWQAFRMPAASAGDGDAPALGQRQMVLRGLVMNVTNPKVLLFFMAFLPQFIEPEKGRLFGQTISLGFLFIVATLLVFGSIAYFSGSFARRLLRSPRIQTGFNYLCGVVFAGLAVQLLLSPPG